MLYLSRMANIDQQTRFCISLVASIEDFFFHPFPIPQLPSRKSLFSS